MKKGDRQDVQEGLESFLTHLFCMCLPTVKAKSIATCRPHNGGGGLPFVFKRSEAAQKKKVKEPFFLHAEG